MNLKQKLAISGSILSMNNGGEYNFPGRSDTDMSSVNGTIHCCYSTTGNPSVDSISPRWIGQFGATINAIPQPTSLVLSGVGRVNANPYRDNLPT
jgi:hypothetical protein